MIYNHKFSGKTHSSLSEMREDLRSAAKVDYYYNRNHDKVTKNKVFAYKTEADYGCDCPCKYYEVSIDKNGEIHFSKPIPVTQL